MGEVSDARLIDAVAGWSRTAAAAEARKFAALAELKRRADARGRHPDWVCDGTDNAAAQVACALTISHGRALGWMDTAVTLRDRLPRVAALFLAGQVSERVIARILALTRLVDDTAVWAELDGHFAAAATGWGVLSGDKLDAAINLWIHTLDPDAVRRARERVRRRDVTIGKHDDQSGTTTVYAVINSLDAAVAAARLRAMVAGVCANDPRTLAQKRTDAFGAVFAGVYTLKCLCGDPDCPATQNSDGRAASVVVHVVADKSALAATPDPTIHGPHPTDTPEPAASVAESVRGRAAVIMGLRGVMLPAPLLAEAIAHGATVRFVTGIESLATCPGYRPSVALDEFIRARDLTCRIPGCDRPAVYADIDHIDPWPGGPTHPANLGCKCRLHHLLKTFWDGWSEQQSPDGTLQITTPTGHTYSTRPFSALLFPSWVTTATDPPPVSPPPEQPAPGRERRMPTRRRSRADAHAAYITAERRRNAIGRERDRIAAAQAAAQAAAKRRAQRDALRAYGSRGAAWAERLDRIDHTRQALSRRAGHQPDYGNDPPPF